MQTIISEASRSHKCCAQQNDMVSTRILFDMVRERKYWLSELGFCNPVSIKIENRQILNGANQELGTKQLKNYIALNEELIKKEKKNEIIILSLLNSLKKLSEKV